MDMNEINNQIKENEDLVNNLKNKLDDISNNIVVEIKSFIKEEYQEEIERYVKKNTENTKRLGIENLRLLKSEMKDLITKSSSLVDKYIGDDSWTHKDYTINENDEFGQKYNLKTTIRTKIGTITSKLYGHLGYILIKYQYINYGSAWEKQNNTEIPKYRYGMSYSKILDDLIDKYLNLFEQLHDNLVTLNKLIKEKEEKEALDLWNQV